MSYSYRPLAGISCNSKLHWKSAKNMRKTGKNAYYKAIIPLFAAKEKNVFRKKAGFRGAKRKARRAAKAPAVHKTRPAGQKVLRQGGCFWCCFGRFTGCAPG